MSDMYDHMSGRVAVFLSPVVAIRLKIRDIRRWYAYKYCREMPAPASVTKAANPGSIVGLEERLH